MTTVREVMTTDPIKLGIQEPVSSAARVMRDNDIGDVLVTNDGQGLVGIVTDRDIVVRGVAEGPVDEVTVGSICSEAVAVSPDADVSEAIELMRDQAVRRVPVVEGEMVVGVVSIGDLAIQFDSESVLAEISKAPDNN